MNTQVYEHLQSGSPMMALMTLRPAVLFLMLGEGGIAEWYSNILNAGSVVEFSFCWHGSGALRS